MSRVFGGCRALMAAVRAGTKAAAAPAAEGVAAAAAAGGKAAKPVGIMKPVPVSPAMRRFVGAPEISRAEAVKKVWEHIKAHQLQNPTNKREIYCDEKLKTIFDGKDKVGMMEIARLLGPHFMKQN